LSIQIDGNVVTHQNSAGLEGSVPRQTEVLAIDLGGRRDRNPSVPPGILGWRLFWLFVVAFNLVGVIDLILDYYHAVRVGLPAMAGQLGATYVIPIIYVPLLMITHVVALYWLVRPQPKAAQALASNAVAA
jgi:hypothetical protein